MTNGPSHTLLSWLFCYIPTWSPGVEEPQNPIHAAAVDQTLSGLHTLEQWLYSFRHAKRAQSVQRAAAAAAPGPSEKSESNKKSHRENRSPAIPSCPYSLVQECAVNVKVDWLSIEEEEERKEKDLCFILFVVVVVADVL